MSDDHSYPITRYAYLKLRKERNELRDEWDKTFGDLIKSGRLKNKIKEIDKQLSKYEKQQSALQENVFKKADQYSKQDNRVYIAEDLETFVKSENKEFAADMLAKYWYEHEYKDLPEAKKAESRQRFRKWIQDNGLETGKVRTSDVAPETHNMQTDEDGYTWHFPKYSPFPRNDHEKRILGLDEDHEKM